MKKILTIVALLVLSMFLLSCVPTELTEEEETALDELSDAELDALDNQAVAGQATHNGITYSRSTVKSYRAIRKDFKAKTDNSKIFLADVCKSSWKQKYIVDSYGLTADQAKAMRDAFCR